MFSLLLASTGCSGKKSSCQWFKHAYDVTVMADCNATKRVIISQTMLMVTGTYHGNTGPHFIHIVYLRSYYEHVITPHGSVWDVITHSCPNFDGASADLPLNFGRELLHPIDLCERNVMPMQAPTSLMMTSSNGNIFRVTGHLCREFTGHRWIPRTKASDSELWCFLWSTPE